MHVGGGADVEPAGRLVRQDDARGAVEAAGEDHLLDVAAGESRIGASGPGSGCRSRDRRGRACARTSKRRKPRRWTSGAEVFDDQVLGDAERADDRLVVAVLRDARDAGAAPRGGSRRAARRTGVGAAASPRTAPCRRSRRARPARCPKRRRCRRSRPRAPSARPPCAGDAALAAGTRHLDRGRARRPAGGRGSRRARLTSRPTIRAASSRGRRRRPAGPRPCGRRAAPRRGRRSPAPRRSLCEMKTTEKPRSPRRRSTANKALDLLRRQHRRSARRGRGCGRRG